MHLPRLLKSVVFASLLVVQLVAAPVAGRYLRADAVDVVKLIPPAPAADSLTSQADLWTVYELQQRRTPEQVALSRYFAVLSVFQYDAVLGPWFNAAKLPKTAEFFAQIDADRFEITLKGKKVWNRPRPPLVDPRIHPAAPLPGTGSYPSGHSTQSFLWADLLAQVFPEKREALRDRAALVAWSRVIGGVHYPTDITAGRILGDQLADQFLAVPEVRAALEDVEAELHAAAANFKSAAAN